MTKADIINKIASETDIEKSQISKTIEAFMDIAKDSLVKGENIYLRGFGTFEIKKRAEKKARNISKNITMVIPPHNIPFFNPSRQFIEKVKSSNKLN
ncbi:HU family DNA-binding protein [Maribellus maritimus]|uniref:HU family DNA-binding protein n=1 Tax=Maribellus maritimus TaxID=2870838 RepID=UPI001EEC93FF|nr:HU family DNA-binding protein [Maribellus maritimus]MCG6188036.1 integration host factor subunit beta [Maribellus maritimus]